jgi:hypothetical protein
MGRDRIQAIIPIYFGARSKNRISLSLLPDKSLKGIEDAAYALPVRLYDKTFLYMSAVNVNLGYVVK